MKTDVLKEKPESHSTDFILAFDLDKFGSAGQLSNTVNQLQLLCAAGHVVTVSDLHAVKFNPV